MYNMFQIDQYCIIDGHTNEKITRICVESNCKKRLLCSECYFNNHSKHQVLKIDEFLKKIQRLISENQFNFEQINNVRSKKINIFKESLEKVLINLENQFQKHQKQLQQYVKELLEFKFQSVTEEFIELAIDVDGKNILEINYDQLKKLASEQNEILTSTLKQFQNISESLVLNEILIQYIQSKQQLNFIAKKYRKLIKFRENIALQEVLSQRKKYVNSKIYFGETKENKFQGGGIMINVQEQIIFDGVWQNNILLWGKRIEIVNGRIRGSIGCFDDQMKNCGECQVLFDDQYSYKGELSKGQFSGSGVIKYKGKEMYEGNFQNDLFHGYGKQFLQNSELYEGNFYQGKRHKQGQYTFADGKKYKGEFTHDSITGQGEFRDKNDNLKSRGSYLNGKNHGQGKVILNNQEIQQICQRINSKLISMVTQSDFGFYEGQFAFGKFEGAGILELTNIFKYEGYFKDAQFEGKGILQIYQSNKLYIGRFKQSDFSYGYYKCPDYQYFGNFRDNMMHGKGIFYDLNKKSSYAGQFKQNKKQGKGKQQLEDKTFYKGQFSKDLKNGVGQTLYYEQNLFFKFFGDYKDGFECKGTMTYVDGSSYNGEFLRQKKQGSGIFYLKNGDIQEGQFQNDQHESGKYHYFNGDIFKGKFQYFENTIVSEGEMIYKNGNNYQGKLINLQKQGKGIFIYQHENYFYKYSGEFLNDFKHGDKCILEKFQLVDYQKKTIEVYKGQFDSDRFVDKYAEIEIVDHFKYFGPVENFIMTGKGKIEYSNTTKYEGDVVQGKKHGEGSLFYNGFQGKQIYTGQFWNDKEQGKGKLQYLNNEVYEGEFSCGLKNGQGVLYKQNQKNLQIIAKIYDGSWKNDQYHGFGVLCDLLTKQIYEGNFFQGKEQGQGKILMDMKIKIYEGHFLQGKKQGQGTSYFPNGDIEYEGEFKEGLKWGKGRLNYFGKGKINFYDGQFVNDEKHGEGFEGYSSGQAYRGGFSNNKRKGYGIYQFSNGDRYEGQFDEKMNDPQGTMYYSNGERSIGEFVNDKPSGLHKFYKADSNEPFAEKQYSGKWFFF